jgi:hypothetical protein
LERLPLLVLDPNLCEGIVGDDGDDVKGENIIASVLSRVSKKDIHNRRSIEIDEVG